MLGKTNACVGGSGGGSGETIEVLNKTGAVINQGDKVWLSENTQVAGSSYAVGSGNVNSTANSYIDRTGNFAVFNGAMFSVDSEKITNIGEAPQQYINLLYYDDDNSVVFDYGGYIYRVDSNMQFSKSASGYCGDGFITTSSQFSSGGYPLYKINMADGKTLKTYALPSSTKPTVVIGDIVYIIDASATSFPLTYYDLSEGVYPTILTKKNGTLLNNTVKRSARLVGVTADKKYIITCTSTYSYNNGNLTMYEVVSKTQLRQLSMSEMPADLQEFFGIKGCYTFNQYTGVLTATASEGTSYAVVKYENGEWTKIPVDLPAFNRKFFGYLTVSDDLSRAMVVCQNGGYTQSYIVNLTTLDGYTAIPYKPYTVNENTITATALAESQPNELTQVQIGSVTNEDLTVTENGTYTPSATYTGFGSVTVNIESPMQVVTAINKTGETINSGDKVWLNENTQSADTSYILDSGSANFGSYGFINSSGLVAYGSKGKYSLDATSGTLIDSSFTIFPYLLYYTSAGCMYYRQRSGGASGLGVYFITPTGEVSWTMPTLINSNGYSVSTSSSVSTIKKYNTLTQELEQTWETTLPSSSYAVYFIVKNMVYVGYSNAFKYKTLYDDGTVSESWIDATKPSSLPSANCIIGNTLDEKYIVSIGNNYNYGFQKGGAKLQMWETLDSGDIVYLTQSEMPADLQKYVDGNNLITFNPKNGVLAVCKYNEQTYDIVKYENETWTKLPIQLNLEEGETFESAITLSEDLTRACVRTTNGAKIFNLTDLDGYTAISYNPSAVNAQSLTGIASSTAEPNAEVEVGVVK